MAGRLAFLAEGFRELGRRARRAELRRRLAAQDRERQRALVMLGRTAWRAGADLAEWADLRGEIETLERRAGDLAATSKRLGEERAALEARRQSEVARTEAALKPARAAQAEAATALRAARAALSEKDHTTRQLEARLAALAQDLQRQSGGPAAPPAQDAPAATTQDRRQTVEAQQIALRQQLTTEAEARKPIAAAVTARQAGSQRCADEIVRIEREGKSVLVPIDADLKRVRQESGGTTRDGVAVDQALSTKFGELGAALYGRGVSGEAVADHVQAVAGLEEQRASTQSAIDASLEVTHAMARGTMAKFWGVAVAAPVLLFAIAVGLYAGIWAFGPTVFSRAERPRTGREAARSPNHQETRKDETVQTYLRRRGDSKSRAAAVEVLQSDLLMLGSSADRSCLPLLTTIVRRGEPELRAAAAQAIGMLRPTSAEMPALVEALKDPVPLVRDAVVAALDQARDPQARLLARRAHAGMVDRPHTQAADLTPTALPGASQLGVPVYPGATFLAFASDLEIGRLAFTSPDPAAKVVAFYVGAAGRPAVGGEELSRLYFGGSPDNPSGAKHQAAAAEAWFKEAAQARRPDREIQAEIRHRAARTNDLPLVRYADAALYGAPVFVAFEDPPAAAPPTGARFVAVFEDRSLGRTGFELHLTPAGKQP